MGESIELWQLLLAIASVIGMILASHWRHRERIIRNEEKINAVKEFALVDLKEKITDMSVTVEKIWEALHNKADKE